MLGCVYPEVQEEDGEFVDVQLARREFQQQVVDDRCKSLWAGPLQDCHVQLGELGFTSEQTWSSALVDFIGFSSPTDGFS